MRLQQAVMFSRAGRPRILSAPRAVLAAARLALRLARAFHRCRVLWQRAHRPDSCSTFVRSPHVCWAWTTLGHGVGLQLTTCLQQVHLLRWISHMLGAGRDGWELGRGG